MHFLQFLTESFLIEGGAALKGVTGVTQLEVEKATSELVAKIAKELGIKKQRVKVVGSAGRKPSKDSISGDIDVIVQASKTDIETVLPKLADEKIFRAMPGINVYSFAHKIGNKLVQIDLIPVKNIKFAEWSYQANEADLKSGLKGSHRNELFFATAKHAGLVKRSSVEGGEVDEMERHFYDLSRGLMRGTQSKVSTKGKILKSWKTKDKTHVSDDPEEITKILFGPIGSGRVNTFADTLKAIMSPKFPHKEARGEILALAARGMEKKGLTIPSSLLELVS